MLPCPNHTQTPSMVTSVPIQEPPRKNLLLAAIPELEFEHFQSNLEAVWMPFGKVIHESGDRLQHVYFPTSSIVSLLYVMEDGGSAEVAIVGNEGMLGIALLMGGETMPNRAVVISEGFAYRVQRSALKLAFNRQGGRRACALNSILLRYTQALVTQMAQTAVCNRHHSVAQQLCRWFLQIRDRLSDDKLNMTQELIATMLGVRREGITEAAKKLQTDGVIQYNRGHITIIDRSELEARVCECYEVVKKEYERLLTQPA